MNCKTLASCLLVVTLFCEVALRPLFAYKPVILQVFLDNGIVVLTLSKPGGAVTGIRFNGVDNLLEPNNEELNRGYWDMVWSDQTTTRRKGNFDRLLGNKFSVVKQTDDLVEVSFLKTWKPVDKRTGVPLKVDKRFIVMRGYSGFYTYAIYERLFGWPAFNLSNTRIAFKLRKDKFHYMAISDDRQRYMPLPDDRLPDRGTDLAYPEAVRLVNPVEGMFKGEVDDKYQYSAEHRNIVVHGWISSGSDPVGFWQITPSNEFRSGGPLKQSLTSHVGPTSLTVFHSTHYAGLDIAMIFGPNEPWKKVFGPISIYLNSGSENDDEKEQGALWREAKKQAEIEKKKWPYDFVASEDFATQRGRVTGKLTVSDEGITKPARQACVILAKPGSAGSWQIETKGYQYWNETDDSGYFTIDKVTPGEYSLFAYVPGYIGDYKYDTVLTIKPSVSTNLGEIVYNPPRDGPTLWEIGIPDRSSAEFFIPEANPYYVNKLYVKNERFRQYGLWERYSELYSEKDLVFTVGSSESSTDWFYAQVTRGIGNNTYLGTTWQIKFNLKRVYSKGKYCLRVALATANVAELQIRVNDPTTGRPLYSTGVIGRDNTIARHGVHGLYRLYTIGVPGTLLSDGWNTVYLTQTRSVSPFQGVMYDYLRLEGPVF